MGRYLNKVLLFGLLLFSILTVADYCFSSMIRKSNWRSVESWEEIIEGNIQADIIVSGSSRAWVQVDPSIIDSVLCVNSYNLGINGSQINRQVQKYEIYRERNKKPRIIIQNIDFCSLGYVVGYEKEQFLPFFWDNNLKKTFTQSEPFTFCEKYLPLYRYHGLNPAGFLRSTPRTLYKGYQGQNEVWNGDAFMKVDSIKFKVNDTTFCLFDSFLKQTKEDSIHVVFVYAPLYYGATQKTTNREEMYHTYQNIADKYEIPILDYSEMWICYDTTYFYNATHLNKTGAEIYTDSLANDIKRLNIL